MLEERAWEKAEEPGQIDGGRRSLTVSVSELPDGSREEMGVVRRCDVVLTGLC